MVAHAVITALKMLGQEDCEFHISLGYIVRPCLTVFEEKKEKDKRRRRINCYNHVL